MQQRQSMLVVSTNDAGAGQRVRSGGRSGVDEGAGGYAPVTV